MKIAILSPTIFESASILNYLEHNFELKEGVYSKEGLQISLTVSGVGLVHTAISTTKALSAAPDLIILIGLAGAFKRDIELGTVVNVLSEQYADLGAEDKDGSFISVHDLGLIEKDKFPFKEGKLYNASAAEFTFLKPASSLSVNKVTGSANSIQGIKERFDADIENMEGAAFFQVCLKERQKCLQIRAISNYVEPRNKDNWQLGLALENLSQTIIALIEGVQS